MIHATNLERVVFPAPLTPISNKWPCTGNSNHTHPHAPHLGLLEYPVDPQDVIEDFVKQDQRHVQLFLVEHFEPRLNIVPEFLLVHGKIVLRYTGADGTERRRGHLGDPIAVEYGSLERLLTIDVWEVLEGHQINVLLGPHSLFVEHQSSRIVVTSQLRSKVLTCPGTA